MSTSSLLLFEDILNKHSKTNLRNAINSHVHYILVEVKKHMTSNNYPLNVITVKLWDDVIYSMFNIRKYFTYFPYRKLIDGGIEQLSISFKHMEQIVNSNNINLERILYNIKDIAECFNMKELLKYMEQI